MNPVLYLHYISEIPIRKSLLWAINFTSVKDEILLGKFMSIVGSWCSNGQV
jgi:hypothetical protein